MTAARDLFITGLKNAHAMERQAQEMLERQSERMTDYPELKAKAHEHLLEIMRTRRLSRSQREATDRATKQRYRQEDRERLDL